MILDACREAAIQPQEIAYIECHGTGTKIGDPIEISALQRTIAKDRLGKCYLGSVKSNIGHLESAAGIAGLIKSVLILYNGIIPPNLHFNRPNQYIDFDASNLQVVSQKTAIDPQTYIGISSFGFGGTNAHIIIKGVGDTVRKKIETIDIPFDRSRSSALNNYFQIDALEVDRRKVDSGAAAIGDTPAPGTPAGFSANNGNDHKLSRAALQKLIEGLFFKVTNIQSIEPDVELIEQGLDSMSLTEFISQLQTRWKSKSTLI